jgi:hypothetical protein
MLFYIESRFGYAPKRLFFQSFISYRIVKKLQKEFAGSLHVSRTGNSWLLSFRNNRSKPQKIPSE